MSLELFVKCRDTLQYYASIITAPVIVIYIGWFVWKVVKYNKEMKKLKRGDKSGR